jgi:hypothetical protein
MTGPDLANWRQQQVLELAKIAHKCKPLTAQWFAEVGDVPQGVQSLRAGFNLAFIAVVLEAIDWPDKGLCASLLRGFQLYGDLSGDDSGISRQKSEQEMADERPAFDKASAELGNHAANLQWLERCHSFTLAQGTPTAHPGKRKSPGDGVDADGTRETLLHEVMRETLDQERRGFIGPAMTKEAMMAKHTVNGVFMARPLPRFGIHQGFKTNSEGELVMKTRCIDDAKIAGVNAGTLMSEALVMPTFEFIAKVGGHICAKSDDHPEFDLVLGLEDMFAAFRRFGNSSEHASVVAVFNPTTRAVEYRNLYGLPMGNSSSPVQFCRVPEAFAAVTQLFCAVPVAPFVDDLMMTDRGDASITVNGRAWRSSGQWAGNQIHKLGGMDFSPEKHQEADETKIALGVGVDLTAFRTTSTIRFTPTPERCAKLVTVMELAQHDDYLHPREAESLLGKLNFTLSACPKGVGRAATQPLISRATGNRASAPPAKGNKFRWTSAMVAMLIFFKALFANVPHLDFCFREDARGKLIIYSDACQSTRRNGLGVLLIDHQLGHRWFSSDVCPTWLIEAWSCITGIPWPLHSDVISNTMRRQHINALELLAVLAAVFTFGPQYMRNRQVVFFVDNTACLAACVHGYARSPHMAALSNALHLALAHLKCHAWWEYVPSQANGADFPSRLHCPEAARFYNDEGFQTWPSPMRLPSSDNLSFPSLEAVEY